LSSEQLGDGSSISTYLLAGFRWCFCSYFYTLTISAIQRFPKKVKRIDYIGNILIMGATAAVLCALTYGGSRYAWSSWRIIVPLVLGLVGLAIFMIFEQSRFCRELVVPPRLFKSRTSLVVFINTYLFTVLLYWVLFFIPVYFQAILGSSPARAGVQMLPITLVAIPGAVIAVIILSKFGKYKALHMVGFTILTLGMGLFAYLDRLLRCGVDHFPNHSRAWIWYGPKHLAPGLPSPFCRIGSGGSHGNLGIHAELRQYMGGGYSR
jgi:hypothetical protein